MRKIIISIFVFLLGSTALGKSPHGDKLKIKCSVCHIANNWNTIKTNEFNHNSTHFPLTGQHKTLGCRKCHPTLEFSKAKTECVSCHTDVHQGTVGRDCDRCHTTKSWIVTNVKQIHQIRGFALVGLHATADCNRCHTSASQLRFDNLRTDCYACHKADYDKTNHRADGFDTDCFRCHNMTGKTWSSTGNGFEHGFFPLIGGHQGLSCTQCHVNGIKIKPSPQCNSCHEHIDDYARAKSAIPAHSNSSKIGKYSCTDCHSAVGWTSVKFKKHDGWFGIYSGKHKGEWDRCTDCHNNDLAYKDNCKKCHK